MKQNFKDWLEQQPEEFVINYTTNNTFGNGSMTVEELRELDNIFNPEDNND